MSIVCVFILCLLHANMQLLHISRDIIQAFGMEGRRDGSQVFLRMPTDCKFARLRRHSREAPRRCGRLRAIVGGSDGSDVSCNRRQAALQNSHRWTLRLHSRQTELITSLQYEYYFYYYRNHDLNFSMGALYYSLDVYAHLHTRLGK